jgi:MFS family permease
VDDLDDGQYLHVDERCGGRLADDIADHLARAGGAGAVGLHPAGAAAGLPSGALADILDRRRLFIVTQFWVAAVALLLCLAVLSGQLTPYLLLALVFANGIGLAMRWPVFSALIPELVPKHHLPLPWRSTAWP